MTDDRKFDEYVKQEFSNFTPTVSPQIWENIVAKRGTKKPVGFWTNFLNTKNISILIGTAVVLTTSVFVVKKNTNLFESKQPAVISLNKEAVPSTSTTSDNKNNNTTAELNNTVVPAPLSTFTNRDKNVEINNVGISASRSNTNKFSTRDHNSYLNVNKQNNNLLSATNNTEDKNDNSINDATIINDINATTNTRLTFNAPVLITAEKQTAVLFDRTFPNVIIPGCPTVEEQAAGNKKYVEVYVSPDFTIRNFSDTSQSIYLQKRKASTEVSSAYSAGIRFGRVFNNGISLKAGLNYSQVNEKFSFVQNNIVQITYVIDAVTGDTTGSYTIVGTRKKTTYNKYRTLDIPLLMGYELGNGRLHVNINAGAMINIYSWQRGEVLDTNYKPVSITTGKSAKSPYQFKTNMGVGLTGGIGFYYKLTDQLHLLAEPYFRYNLKPMSKQTLTLEQKYNNVGLRLGVRLDLQ